MRVFRVQNADGRGPYDSDVMFQFRYDKRNPLGASERHPMPFDMDTSLRWKREGLFTPYHFGFKSREQALEWFHLVKWRKALAKAGQVLTEWNVPKRSVIVANRQVLFKRDKATLARSEPFWVPAPRRK